MKLLLEAGANVNLQGYKCGSALELASSKGHDAIVKLLLTKDIDIRSYIQALYQSSTRGHEVTMKVLLETNIAHAETYGNALLEASSRSREAIVKVLLENGVDIHSSFQLGWYSNQIPI